ncbi:hypothetical protein D9M72_420240 [compost metagenome]
MAGLLGPGIVAHHQVAGQGQPALRFRAVAGGNARRFVPAEVFHGGFGQHDAREGLVGAVEQACRVQGLARKHVAEPGDGVVERGRDRCFGLHRRNARQDAEPRRQPRIALGDGDAERLRQHDDVVDAPTENARMVQRGRQREDPGRRQRAQRRLETRHAAERRRNPDRAAGIGAEPGRHRAAGDRRGGAAAGAARDPAGVERVQGVAEGCARGRDAPREFMRGGLADHDRAALHERPHHLGIGARHVAQVCLGAVAGLDAAGVDQVLDRNGQSFQRPRLACLVAAVAVRRGLERALPVDHRKGMEVALARFGPNQGLLGLRVGRRAAMTERGKRVAQARAAGEGGALFRRLHHRLSSKASSAASWPSPRSPTSSG